MKTSHIPRIVLAAFFLALAFRPASAQWFADFENGITWSGYNDVRIPGDTGTLFSLSKDLKIDSSYFFRVRLGRTFSGKHTVFLFAAPLSLNASGQVGKTIKFFEDEFPAGVPLKALYRFNSYRVTYRFDFLRKKRWTAGIGLTAKIRDAEIRVEGAGKASSKTNVGIVPLIHFRAEYRLGEKWSLLLDGDALAAPGGQGRAEDVLLAVQFRPGKTLSLKAGYRAIEGGADVEEVYNFALLHFLVLGANIHF
jgi:hypothetical protein